LKKFRRRQITTVVYQCKHGGVVQPYPHRFAVPNVDFAEPYAHLPQRQQNVATIGGYAARNMQFIAANQTNANQMGEGNTNVAYMCNTRKFHHNKILLATWFSFIFSKDLINLNK
jgi:hypothetical protein